MAKIPLGNFGNLGQSPVIQGSVSSAGIDATARAAENLGRTGMQLAANAIEQKRQDDLALARAKAGNAALDREMQVKRIVDEARTGLKDGRLKYDTIEEYYNTALGKLTAPTLDGLDAADVENFGKGIKRIDSSGLNSIYSLREQARASEFKGQADLALDKFGKIAGETGSDVNTVNKQIDSLDELGKVAYGPNWERVKQSAKDANWYNQATNRVMTSRQDMDALNQIESDLTEKDGFYAGKLDTERRNQLLNSVINSKLQLEARNEQNAAKAVARTNLNLNEIDRRISSTIPIPQEDWDKYMAQAKGTGLEADIVTRLKEEMDIQDMIRKPIDEQIKFVQEREAQLKQGGDLREAANVQRMANAVRANVKQLQDSPLLFNESRTGQVNQPIDLSLLAQPNGAAQMQSLIADRVSDITAMQEKYGDMVAMRPLLPQEAGALAAMVNNMEPTQQGQLFGALRKSFPDTKSFVAAMQQIAPDAPIKARAGAMMATGGDATINEGGWFSDKVTKSAPQIAETMLTGESILNKTKQEKSIDGKAKSFPTPPEADFRRSFSDEVGDAYADNPDVYESDMQAVRAYYVGKSAQDGDVSGEVDTQRMREAIKSVVGTVANINGNGDVIAPWGMDDVAFEDAMDAALINTLRKRGAESQIEDRDRFGFKNAGNGKYFLTEGRNYVIDEEGKPIVVDIAEVAP